MGKDQLLPFCEHENVPYESYGNVIVATESVELSRLETILDRGHRNGVTCEMSGLVQLQRMASMLSGLRHTWAGDPYWRL